MPETTTDFELLQQSLKPFRETIRRLHNLAWLLRRDRPVHDLTGDHSQRYENVRHLAGELEMVFDGIQSEVWRSMYLSPLTLIREGIDEEQMCRVCGCTEHDACSVPKPEPGRQGCSWTEADLCSVCAELPSARPREIPLDAQIAAVMERIVARCCVFEETLDPEIQAAVREYQELVMEQSRVLGNVQ